MEEEHAKAEIWLVRGDLLQTASRLSPQVSLDVDHGGKEAGRVVNLAYRKA